MFKAARGLFKMSKSHTILGVDIGSKTIKVVEIKYIKKKLNVIKTFTLSNATGDTITEKTEVDMLETLGQSIKELIHSEGIKAKKLSMVMNGSSIGVRTFSLPPIKKKDMTNALMIDLAKTFPNVMKTHYIQYKLWNTNRNAPLKGLLTFCPQSIIEKYMYLSKVIGIQLAYLDVSANCLSKSFNHFIKTEEECVVIVDIGFMYSQINIVDNGYLVLSRTINCGGRSLDKLIADSLQISTEEGEIDKLSKFINCEMKGYDEIEFIKKAYQPIVNEINYSISHYKKIREINRVLFLGGGSKLLGMEILFGDVLNMECRCVTQTHNYKEYIKDFEHYMISIGACIREERK